MHAPTVIIKRVKRKAEWGSNSPFGNWYGLAPTTAHFFKIFSGRRGRRPLRSRFERANHGAKRSYLCAEMDRRGRRSLQFGRSKPRPTMVILSVGATIGRPK